MASIVTCREQCTRTRNPCLQLQSAVDCQTQSEGRVPNSPISHCRLVQFAAVCPVFHHKIGKHPPCSPGEERCSGLPGTAPLLAGLVEVVPGTAPSHVLTFSPLEKRRKQKHRPYEKGADSIPASECRGRWLNVSKHRLLFPHVTSWLASLTFVTSESLQKY